MNNKNNAIVKLFSEIKFKNLIYGVATEDAFNVIKKNIYENFSIIFEGQSNTEINSFIEKEFSCLKGKSVGFIRKNIFQFQTYFFIDNFKNYYELKEKEYYEKEKETNKNELIELVSFLKKEALSQIKSEKGIVFLDNMAKNGIKEKELFSNSSTKIGFIGSTHNFTDRILKLMEKFNIGKQKIINSAILIKENVIYINKGNKEEILGIDDFKININGKNDVIFITNTEFESFIISKLGFNSVKAFEGVENKIKDYNKIYILNNKELSGKIEISGGKSHNFEIDNIFDISSAFADENCYTEFICNKQKKEIIGFENYYKALDYTEDNFMEEIKLSLNNVPDELINKIKFIKENNKIINIVGDFDADGIVSIAILKNALKKYGINSEKITYQFLQRGDKRGIDLNKINKECDVIIFTDFGTNNIEEINELKQNGIESIIIDHHEKLVEYSNQEILLYNPKTYNSTEFEKVLPAIGLATIFDMKLNKKEISDIMDIYNELNIIEFGIKMDMTDESAPHYSSINYLHNIINKNFNINGTNFLEIFNNVSNDYKISFSPYEINWFGSIINKLSKSDGLLAQEENYGKNIALTFIENILNKDLPKIKENILEIKSIDKEYKKKKSIFEDIYNKEINYPKEFMYFSIDNKFYNFASEIRTRLSTLDEVKGIFIATKNYEKNKVIITCGFGKNVITDSINLQQLKEYLGADILEIGGHKKAFGITCTIEQYNEILRNKIKDFVDKEIIFSKEFSSVSPIIVDEKTDISYIYKNMTNEIITKRGFYLEIRGKLKVTFYNNVFISAKIEGIENLTIEGYAKDYKVLNNKDNNIIRIRGSLRKDLLNNYTFVLDRDEEYSYQGLEDIENELEVEKFEKNMNRNEMTTKVTGITFSEEETILEFLNSKKKLILEKEESNGYDKNAVAVGFNDENGVFNKIGYVNKISNDSKFKTALFIKKLIDYKTNPEIKDYLITGNIDFTKMILEKNKFIKEKDFKSAYSSILKIGNIYYEAFIRNKNVIEKLIKIIPEDNKKVSYKEIQEEISNLDVDVISKWLITNEIAIDNKDLEGKDIKYLRARIDNLKEYKKKIMALDIELKEIINSSKENFDDVFEKCYLEIQEAVRSIKSNTIQDSIGVNLNIGFDSKKFLSAEKLEKLDLTQVSIIESLDINKDVIIFSKELKSNIIEKFGFGNIKAVNDSLDKTITGINVITGKIEKISKLNQKYVYIENISEIMGQNLSYLNGKSIIVDYSFDFKSIYSVIETEKKNIEIFLEEISNNIFLIIEDMYSAKGMGLNYEFSIKEKLEEKGIFLSEIEYIFNDNLISGFMEAYKNTMMLSEIVSKINSELSMSKNKYNSKQKEFNETKKPEILNVMEELKNRIISLNKTLEVKNQIIDNQKINLIKKIEDDVLKIPYIKNRYKNIHELKSLIEKIQKNITSIKISKEKDKLINFIKADIDNSVEVLIDTSISYNDSFLDRNVAFSIDDIKKIYIRNPDNAKIQEFIKHCIENKNIYIFEKNEKLIELLNMFEKNKSIFNPESVISKIDIEFLSIFKTKNKEYKTSLLENKVLLIYEHIKNKNYNELKKDRNVILNSISEEVKNDINMFLNSEEFKPEIINGAYIMGDFVDKKENFITSCLSHPFIENKLKNRETISIKENIFAKHSIKIIPTERQGKKEIRIEVQCEKYTIDNINVSNGQLLVYDENKKFSYAIASYLNKMLAFEATNSSSPIEKITHPKYNSIYTLVKDGVSFFKTDFIKEEEAIDRIGIIAKIESKELKGNIFENAGYIEKVAIEI